MKKILLIMLMVMGTMIFSLGEVHASGDPGFEVYAFTATDTTHTIASNVDLSKLTLFIDGKLAYDRGNTVSTNFIVETGNGTSYYFSFENDDEPYESGTLNSGGVLVSGYSIVMIISDDSDSFNAWGFTPASTTHNLVVDEVIDRENLIVVVGGQTWFSLGSDILNPAETNGGSVRHTIDGASSALYITNDDDNEYFFLANGSTEFYASKSIVIIEAVSTNPYPEMDDFIFLKEFDDISAFEFDEVETQYDAMVFGLWENPEFVNRLYVVPTSLDFYRGDGEFNVLNDAFIDLDEYVVPTTNGAEFTVIHEARIQFTSDDGSDLNDYYLNLKIWDIEGDSFHSVPIALNFYTIQFRANYTIVDGLPVGDYTDVYVNNNPTAVGAYGNVMVYMEGLPDNVVPDIDGQVYYSTTYDQVISESTIRANISVWDAVDGDLTHAIVLVSDLYTPNSDTVGSWDITYSATDSSNNTSYLVVTVVVFDNLAPVITGGQASYTVSYTQTFNTTNMLAAHTATDDHDGVIPITIQSNTYTASKTIPGTYEIVIVATDSSDNETTKTITIYVVDDVAPTITAPATITKDATTTLTLQQILNQVTAADAIDGNITASVQVFSNAYAGNSMNIGTWPIVLKVSDEAGNQATKTINVVVVDELPGVWYVVDGFFLNVAPTVLLSMDNIIETLVIANKITSEEAETVVVISDSYTSNASTLGNHGITLGYVTLGVPQTLSLTIRVTDLGDVGDDYTVLFITNGGSYIAPQVVVSGSLVTRPTDPVRSGYEFSGWYEDIGLTQPWSFTNNLITQDTNLYAKWTLEESAAGDPQWVEILEQYWLLGLAVVVLIIYATGRSRRKW